MGILMAVELASIDPDSRVLIKEPVLLTLMLDYGADLQGGRPKSTQQECPTGIAACQQFDA